MSSTPGAPAPSHEGVSSTASAQRGRWAEPPTVPSAFWTHQPLAEALATGHMGLVVRAYREHPWHGHRPIPQEIVGSWLGSPQCRISKIETGPARQHLDWLRFVARTLRIPDEHLWFSLGNDVTADARPIAGRAVPQRNDRFRAARLRSRCPGDAGIGMSRRALAEAVNAYRSSRCRTSLRLDHSYVGKLERGEVRWPRFELREALRAVLGVSSDTEIGFYPTRGRAAADSWSEPVAMQTPPLIEPIARAATAVATDGRLVTITVMIAGHEAINISLDLSAVADTTTNKPTSSSHSAVVRSLSRARQARAARGRAPA